ncbi:unnamed protein product [Urochloa decumbens]|uniref:Wound induced protein n=1 Tax=Urochloa decumbens TaxID=240449 RepID=A0ABC8ZSK9_9POAL
MSAASSVSKKASSFVVTASMGAVEALKDQAGLCRWDYAIRSLYNRAAAAKVTGRAVPVSLQSSSSSSQTAGSSCAAASAAGRAARPRRTEEERLQKTYHLVCWGPN